MVQHIEYVFSREEERLEYYDSQYEFSGPAMRRLHDRDLNGRFIGVEVGNRLAGDGDVPDWDVVHVAGFTPLQMIRAVPHFRRAFADAAAALDGPDYRERMLRWDQQRDKLEGFCHQLPTHGLVRSYS